MSEIPRAATEPDRISARTYKLISRRGRLIALISLSMLVTLTALLSTATLSENSSAKTSRNSLNEMSLKSSTSNHRSRHVSASQTPQDADQGEASQTPTTDKPSQETGRPDVVPMIGPVSQDKDLRKLPYIPPRKESEDQRLRRHPFPPPTEQGEADERQQGEVDSSSTPKEPFSSLAIPTQEPLLPLAMPTPSVSFDGVTSVESGCGCLPPDTDGDIGPNHYIQSVNSSIKIYSKTGTTLSGPTTYNSFFSALGPTTPCGNNQNDGDGVVFYDSAAARWVVSDFAFPAFPGVLFYQCIGVSKTANPVTGGWWLYAVQVDPSNPNYLGDYPKFGLWPDAYYLTVNLFSNNTTFNGVRVYALDRNSMINGTGAPVVAFTISPATLGDAYSLVPATFRFGGPPAGRDEYLLAINSSATAGTVENQVLAWRFHTDFATPANSTLGTGATHAPNANITVNNFVDAFQGTTTNIVPQTGTTAKLDTLGDKLMYPLYYQKLGAAESLYVSHTVNNNQNGTGPTGIRWYQFDVTGGTIPSGAAQQQTFTNNADGLWRWMPSLALDIQGNLSIGYATSSSTTNPAIKYAGRLAGDTPSTLAQGEALLIQGAGHQTSSSGRWGDYSATGVDVTDGCSFWHTNEYFATTSSAGWRTRIGSFKFPTCSALLAYRPPYDFDGDGKSDISIFRGPEGLWAALPSSNPNGPLVQRQWGSSNLGDVIVPADYDGDGKVDFAVYRNGTWYISKNAGGDVTFTWGASTDIPVPADFDGDGKADIAVYRPTEGASQGLWYVLKSSTNYASYDVAVFGASTDKPVAGDYNGDGKADYAVIRRTGGAMTWYILYNGTSTFAASPWGNDTDDVAVPADYDGDRKTDLAVWRASTGTWYVLKSGGGIIGAQFGQLNDIPVAADYDGDQKADLGVFRPGDTTWYIQASTAGLSINPFGVSTDTPVPSAYNR